MVDKNLFLYDLAVVAIMKNEAPYVKEWLDYYLAAGVNHFYIYDNESTDNFKEILQPYIDAGIVTYKFFPGTNRQIEAYLETFKTYRFFCRYMAFIDADEFIFPQSNKSILEVTEDFFNDNSDLGGLGIKWKMYGSNYLEKADYSKGVLERFTRRAAKCINVVKTIANPRKIKYINTPHYIIYFESVPTVEESEKVIINHYKFKSREEFLRKYQLGSVDAVFGNKDYYSADKFKLKEDNEIFDDSILKYFAVRRQMERGTVKPLDYQKSINALIENLAPLFSAEEVPLKFFEGKMETFLTCRALASYLKGNILDTVRGELVENLSLQAIFKTMFTDVSVADAELLFSELPQILPLNYPAVQDIVKACLDILPSMKIKIRISIDDQKKFLYWRDFNEFDDLYRILKAFKK